MSYIVAGRWTGFDSEPPLPIISAAGIVQDVVRDLGYKANYWSASAASSVGALTTLLGSLSSDYNYTSSLTYTPGTITTPQFNAGTAPSSSGISTGITAPGVPSVSIHSTIPSFVRPSGKPVWSDPGIRFSAGTKPGSVPSINYGTAPNIQLPKLKAAPSISPPAGIKTVNIAPIKFNVGANYPTYSGGTISIDTSGAPGSAPAVDLGTPPTVSVSTISGPDNVGSITAPTIVTIPALSLPDFGQIPTWSEGTPSVDFGTEPAAAGSRTVTAMPSVPRPAIDDFEGLSLPADPILVEITAPNFSEFPSAPTWTGTPPTFDFSGAPGSAPSLVYADAPNPRTIVPEDQPDVLQIDAPRAPVISSVAARFGEAPAFAYTFPTIYYNDGKPDNAPTFDTGVAPSVDKLSIASIGSAAAITPIAKPNIAAVDTTFNLTAPAWNTDAPTLDYSGVPDAYIDVSVEAPPSIPVPELGSPTTIVAPTDINVPAISNIALGDYSGLPAWDGSIIEFDVDGTPDAAPTFDWGTAPIVQRPTMPSAPDSTNYPVKPTLSYISIPAFQGLALPDFDVDMSLPVIHTPTNKFSFSQEEYAPAQIALLQSNIARVINGDMGMPAFVWDAVWARAAADLQRQAHGRRREARRAWSKLGWSMPGGTALAASEQAEQDINEQINIQLLEQTVQDATHKREDFWQAVQQGVALERLTFDAWNAYNERALKAAIAFQEAETATYAALVSAYAAEVQRINAAIAIKRMELEGSLAALDEHRLKIEAASLTIEADKRETELYIAEWEGVKSEVAVYTAMLNAIEVDVSAQKANIEAYGARVRTNTAIIEAWGKEWDGYTAKIQAQNLKLGKYQTEAQVFGERVRAYQAKVGGETGRIENALKKEALKLDVARQDTARYTAEMAPKALDLEAFKANAQARATESDVRRTALEAHKLRIEARNLELEAWKTKWEGYATKLQGEQIKTQVYETEAKVHGIEVDAYKTGVDARATEIDSNVKTNQQLIDAAKQDVERYRAELDRDNSNIARYEAMIKARALEIENERVRIAAYQARVDAAELDLKSWTQEWEGYKVRLEAEGLKLQDINAKASVFSSQIQGYQASVQAESARLDAALRGESQKIDVGRVGVESYRAQMEGGRLGVEHYRAGLAKHNISIESDKLQLEAFRANTDSKELQIKAWGQEWEGYKTKLDAENLKVASFDSEVKAFGAEVQGYQAGTQGASAKLGSQIDYQRARIDAGRLGVDAYSAEISGEAQRVDAYRAVAQAKAIEVDIAKLVLEEQKVKIQAKEAEFNALQTEWQGYASRLEGQKLKLDKFDTLTKVFASEVQGYQAGVQGQSAALDAVAKNQDARVNASRAEIEAYKARLQRESEITARYEAGVKAAVSSAEQQRLLIEAHELRLKAAEIEASIYETQWKGYGEKMRSQEVLVKGKELMTKVFDTEVRAYQAAVGAADAKATADARYLTAAVDAGKLDVERYKADWDGEKVKSDLYSSEMRGVLAHVQSQAAAVGAYASTVEAGKAQVDAWAKEWDGYSAQMQGESAKASAVSSYANAFSARMRGYGYDIEGEKAAIEASVAAANLDIESRKLGVERYKAEWQGIAASAAARAALFSGEASMYKAKVDGETSRVEAHLKGHDLRLKSAQLGVDVGMKKAELAMQKLVSSTNVQIRGLETLGNMHAQLGAAAYGAQHVSASIGETASSQNQNSKQWNAQTTNQTTDMQYASENYNYNHEYKHDA